MSASPHRMPAARRGFFGSAMFAGFAGVGGVIALLTLGLVNDYRDARRYAQIDAENTSRLLQEHALAIVSKSDLLLREVQRNVQPDDMRAAEAIDPARRRHYHALLKSIADEVSEVAVIHLTNASGDHVYSSIDPLPKINIADRYHFRRHIGDRASGLVISPPVVSRTTKKWTIVLTRRLEGRDGRFAGIINVILDLDYFQQFYRSLNLGAHGAVSLFDKEFRLAARYPPRDAAMGQVVDMHVKAYIERGIGQASYQRVSALDGVARLYSFRQVDSLPLMVFAGIAEQDYLADSNRHAWQYSIVALIFILVVAAFWLRQRRDDEILRESDERFRTMANYTYDWEYWEGPAHELVFMSPSCERLTGYTQAEFFRDPGLLLAVVHPDDRARIAAHRHETTGEEEASIEFRIVRRDGEIRIIAHGCRAVHGSDGKLLGRRVSNRDITETKRAEEAVRRLNAELEQRVAQRTKLLEAANRELQEFSYSMSHDMRAPLRALDGFSKILLDEHGERLDDEGRRLLVLVRDNAQRMARLIDDIVLFVSIGQRRLDYSEVDVGALAERCFARLQAAEPQRRMRLSHGTLPAAWGDANMLELAFLNLLSNAVKFTRADAEAQVELSGGFEGIETWYAVADHGVGFDMRYAGKLFRVFERVHRTGEYPGNAIGLALVKRIAERHGGRVWAKSELGAGATFYLALPLRSSRALAGSVK